MPRQDRKRIEQPKTKTGRRGESEDHRAVVRGAGVDRLAADHQSVSEWALDGPVPRSPEREQHVGGGQWRSVRPGQAGTKVQRITPSIGSHFPSFGEPWLQFKGSAVDAHEA